MNIQAIIFHMFVNRGFYGLLAFTWGFMLGGSILMTAITYGLALAGLSHYVVTLYQIVALVMLLPVAWGVIEQEYQQKVVINAKTFGSAFLVSLFFGALMPIAIVIGAVVTWREAFRKKATSANDKPLDFGTGMRHGNAVRQPQNGMTGLLNSMQDLMDRSFLKLAH